MVTAIVPDGPALVYSKFVRQLVSDWVTLRPEGGWAAFGRSEELTSFLGSRLGPRHWHYLNLTSNTSAWEHRSEPDGMVLVGYRGEVVEDLRVRGPASAAVASEIASMFGLGSVEDV